jgi:hypothetical protein
VCIVFFLGSCCDKKLQEMAKRSNRFSQIRK